MYLDVTQEQSSKDARTETTITKRETGFMTTSIEPLLFILNDKACAAISAFHALGIAIWLLNMR